MVRSAVEHAKRSGTYVPGYFGPDDYTNAEEEELYGFYPIRFSGGYWNQPNAEGVFQTKERGSKSIDVNVERYNPHRGFPRYNRTSHGIEYANESLTQRFARMKPPISRRRPPSQPATVGGDPETVTVNSTGDVGETEQWSMSPSLRSQWENVRLNLPVKWENLMDLGDGPLQLGVGALAWLASGAIIPTGVAVASVPALRTLSGFFDGVNRAGAKSEEEATALLGKMKELMATGKDAAGNYSKDAAEAYKALLATGRDTAGNYSKDASDAFRDAAGNFTKDASDAFRDATKGPKAAATYASDVFNNATKAVRDAAKDTAATVGGAVTSATAAFGGDLGGVNAAAGSVAESAKAAAGSVAESVQTAVYVLGVVAGVYVVYKVSR